MLNSVNIAGRLTADPEVRQTPNGIPVTTFCVAVERTYRKGDQKETDFIDCVAWRNTATFVGQYFHKGDFVLLNGHLQTRNYEKGESKRKVVELIVDNAYFGPKSANSSQASSPAQVPSYSAGTQEDFSSVTDDEDLPF